MILVRAARRRGAAVRERGKREVVARVWQVKSETIMFLLKLLKIIFTTINNPLIL
jgi:hypothetical protein